MRIAIVVATALVLGWGPARADGPASSVAIGGGLTIQGSSLGSAGVVAGGGFIDGAYRRGAVSLAAEASLQSATLVVDETSPTVDGMLITLGGGVRWTAGRWEPEHFGDEKVGIDLRLAAGAELESYAWQGGGRLTRPAAYVGAGAQFDFGHVSRPARGLIYIGLRLALAEPYATSTVSRAACRGTCTPAPAPTPYDASWGVVIGGAWDR